MEIGLATIYRRTASWARNKPEIAEVYVVHSHHGNLVGPPRPIEFAIGFSPGFSNNVYWESTRRDLRSSLEDSLGYHVDLYRYDSLSEFPWMQEVFRYGGSKVYESAT